MTPRPGQRFLYRAPDDTTLTGTVIRRNTYFDDMWYVRYDGFLFWSDSRSINLDDSWFRSRATFL